ncbi:MAG: flavodoxin domain-containing protein [Kineosporiaceae bacterium]
MVGTVLVVAGRVGTGPGGDLDGADAVVLGSALYLRRWLEPAVGFARDHAEALRERAVWLFSSGPVGEPAMHEGPLDLDELLALTGAREHRVFGGRLDPDELDDGELGVVAELDVTGGDYRDWAAVRGWAARLADDLSGGRPAD